MPLVIILLLLIFVLNFAAHAFIVWLVWKLAMTIIFVCVAYVLLEVWRANRRSSRRPR